MRYESISIPEGRTYSPPDNIGRWYPLRGRALCEALRLRWSLMYNATLAVIVHAVSASTNDTAFVIRGTNCTLPCANCLRKSATTQGTPFVCGSFIAEIGAAFTAPIFFFKKETKIVLRHRKEENSELFPFGS